MIPQNTNAVTDLLSLFIKSLQECCFTEMYMLKMVAEETGFVLIYLVRYQAFRCLNGEQICYVQ